jgi:6,7-dimethyl-8-ribityllumazine synthase
MAARLAIVVAEYNRAIIDVMVAAAEAEAKAANATIQKLVRVPGAYEIPLVLARALGRDDVDAAVVLGYIERGETLHGEVMGHVVHAAIIDLSLHHQKAVGIGIIGPGATLAQAEVRRDGYARAAIRAALALRNAHAEV